VDCRLGDHLGAGLWKARLYVTTRVINLGAGDTVETRTYVLGNQEMKRKISRDRHSGFPPFKEQRMGRPPFVIPGLGEK
jgi:hypothetical protein